MINADQYEYEGKKKWDKGHKRINEEEEEYLDELKDALMFR